METAKLKRVFKHGTRELADPNPTMSPKGVLDFYSLTYPELVNAKVIGPTHKENQVEFEFKNVVGAKG